MPPLPALDGRPRTGGRRSWRRSGRFNLLPHMLPASITELVDKLVPELQERGVYRTEYRGTTLRDHLDLPPLPAA